MMDQGRQVKLEIDRKRLFRGRDGAECFSGPKTSTPKHRKHYLRFRPVADLKPVRREVVMGDVIKKVRIACSIDPMEMEAEHVRSFRTHSFALSLVQASRERHM